MTFISVLLLPGIIWLTLYSTNIHFDASEQTAFENIVGKEEIARNEQFLLSPQCFLLYQISVSPFVHIFDFISLLNVELEESKIGIPGKCLRVNNNLTLIFSLSWQVMCFED